MMNKNKVFRMWAKSLCFIAVALWVAAPAWAAPPGEPPGEPTVGHDRLRIAVEGMTCGGCAKRLEKVLTAVDGVRTASVDLEKKQATISCLGSVTDEMITRAVVDAGFQVDGLVRTPWAKPALSVLHVPEKVGVGQLFRRGRGLFGL
ncbi:MAG: copper chaperone CopZ [Myxococcota bacterium]|jgi:copper chaperone CopZ